MISIDLYSRVPIYQQVIDGIKKDVMLGWLTEGEQITSIRELSVEVGINPNTVSKAYLELERQGILAVSPGKGYFVAPDAAKRIRDAVISEEKSRFLSAAEKLLQSGVSKDEIDDWIQIAIRNYNKKGE